MNTHPYLRAYMAGIAVPTLFLLVVLTSFIVARYIFQIPVPIERVMVFPMALVPNIFGLWNMLYLALRSHRHLPLGFHGALLPFLLAPLGGLLGWALGFLTAGSQGLVYFQQVTIPYTHFAIGFGCGLIFYYLVWKYLVGFLNQLMGIA